jgi:ribosomal protein L29
VDFKKKDLRKMSIEELKALTESIAKVLGQVISIRIEKEHREPSAKKSSEKVS